MVNVENVAADRFEVSRQQMTEHLATLEEDYNTRKAAECEDLHNALVQVLTEKKASIQNFLYVWELIKYEFLRAKYEQIAGNVVVPEGNVPLKKDVRDPIPVSTMTSSKCE
jgi:hypothetical protein